jgi:hypothetical protein
MSLIRVVEGIMYDVTHEQADGFDRATLVAMCSTQRPLAGSTRTGSILFLAIGSDGSTVALPGT